MQVLRMVACQPLLVDRLILPLKERSFSSKRNQTLGQSNQRKPPHRLMRWSVGSGMGKARGGGRTAQSATK